MARQIYADSIIEGNFFPEMPEQKAIVTLPVDAQMIENKMMLTTSLGRSMRTKGQSVHFYRTNSFGAK